MRSWAALKQHVVDSSSWAMQMTATISQKFRTLSGLCETARNWCKDADCPSVAGELRMERCRGRIDGSEILCSRCWYDFGSGRQFTMSIVACEVSPSHSIKDWI